VVGHSVKAFPCLVRSDKGDHGECSDESLQPVFDKH
jgi:hypothetical protein